MDFEIIRNAKIECSVHTENRQGEQEYCLRIVVNDRFSHVFPGGSRESAMLHAMDMPTISAIMSGGTYFFAKNGEGKYELVDYRRGDYKGFVHGDEAVRELSQRLGSEHPHVGRYATPVHGLLNRHMTRRTNGFFLGGPADNFSLEIPSLGEGGSFRNTLYFRWSPFSSNIQTSLAVERLVCLNGMVGMAEAITHTIPLINGWEDNLRVVSTQLKPRINEVLAERFSAMSETRATVRELMSADELIVRQLGQIERMGATDVAAYLSALHAHLDPKRHLSGVYHDSVFENINEQKMSPGHMSQYDVFNILTEASTHAGGTDAQNDRALQMLANRLVFDEMRARRTMVATVPESQESDPTRAFFARD